MRSRESSSSTADRFLRSFTARTGEQPRKLFLKQALAKARLENTIEQWRTKQEKMRVARPTKLPRGNRKSAMVFREIVYEHVGRCAKEAHVIHQEVLNDYGSHTVRRFWRALRDLRSSGLIEITEDGYRRVSSPRAGGPP